MFQNHIYSGAIHFYLKLAIRKMRCKSYNGI